MRSGVWRRNAARRAWQEAVWQRGGARRWVARRAACARVACVVAVPSLGASNTGGGERVRVGCGVALGGWWWCGGGGWWRCGWRVEWCVSAVVVGRKGVWSLYRSLSVVCVCVEEGGVRQRSCGSGAVAAGRHRCRHSRCSCMPDTFTTTSPAVETSPSTTLAIRCSPKSKKSSRFEIQWKFNGNSIFNVFRKRCKTTAKLKKTKFNKPKFNGNSILDFGLAGLGLGVLLLLRGVPSRTHAQRGQGCGGGGRTRRSRRWAAAAVAGAAAVAAA